MQYSNCIVQFNIGLYDTIIKLINKSYPSKDNIKSQLNYLRRHLKQQNPLG